MSLRTLVFLPSGTPCAFFIKRRRDLRLRFVLVEYNPRCSAQSGDQIRYKEYSGSSFQRQRLAWWNSAGVEFALAKNPGLVRIQSRASGPGMCALLWQAAQRVIRFPSESPPEWLRNL